MRLLGWGDRRVRESRAHALCACARDASALPLATAVRSCALIGSSPVTIEGSRGADWLEVAEHIIAI